MDPNPIYVPLLVGWALGLITSLLEPHVTDLVFRKRKRLESAEERRELKRTIMMELRGLQTSLATAAWMLLGKIGKVDVAFMRWYLPIALSHEQSIADALPRDALERLMKNTDDELQEGINSMMKQSTAKGSGINLKKYDLPFLAAHQSELAVFDHNFQKCVLEVRSSLTLFNSDVDLVRALSLKVFEPGMVQDTFDAIQNNLLTLYRALSVRAQDMCKIIELLEKESKEDPAQE